MDRFYQYFHPTGYQLELTLEREKRTFHGKVTISGYKTSDDQQVKLHAKDLAIKSVQAGDTVIRFTHSEDVVTLTPALAKGNHTLTVEFTGQITDGMHGLYPCYYMVGGVKKELLATQFESHHAREVFPCIDEPEAKATFDLTLVTEPDVTVLSNMPLLKSKIQNPSSTAHTFQTTPRMSTYLLAFVVGGLHKKTTRTPSGVEVNVWATKNHAPEVLDFALDMGPRAIDFFEDYFGVAYPLPKIDHVALPDFSAGAMENWGLVTYREQCLLAQPGASIATKQYIASVIVHEVSHQWFGNLVTMKWWNNLWLNESFARLMEYTALGALEPNWHVWDDFAARVSLPALRRDALDGVQAVQTDVSHPDEIATLFDPAIVYSKGARLLAMLHDFVGDDAFRAGLRQYFADHAYGNTTETDMWEALSHTSDKDIATFMTPWISQPGYPVVQWSEQPLSQTQFFIGDHAPSDALWPIPLSSSDKSLPALLETKSATVIPRAGASLNEAATGHFVVNYGPKRRTELLKMLASGNMSLRQRQNTYSEQLLLASAGTIPSSGLVELLVGGKNEQDVSVWALLCDAANELQKFVSDDPESKKLLRHLLCIVAGPHARATTWYAHTDESENDTKLRPLVLGLMLRGEDDRTITTGAALFHTTPLDAVDANIRPLVIQAALLQNPTDHALHERLLEAYRTSSAPELKQALCQALTTTRHADFARQLLASLKDSSLIRPQDVRQWLAGLLKNPTTRPAAWQWVQDEWAWIQQTFAGDMSYDYFPALVANFLTTQQEFAEYQHFFAPKRTVPALTRAIELGSIELGARASLVAEQSDNVKQALAAVTRKEP